MLMSTILVLLVLLGGHSSFGLEKNLNFQLQKWQFLTKFGFFSHMGKVTMTGKIDKITLVQGSTHYQKLARIPNLKIVFDNEIGWQKAYSHYKNIPMDKLTENDCNEMNNNLTGIILDFPENKYIESWDHVTVELTDVKIESTKNVYAFFILFACSNSAKINTTINMVLTNGESWNMFRYQISADHFYVLESLIGLVIFIFLFLGLIMIYFNEVKKADRLSILTILFVIVVIVKVIVYLGEMIIMLVYAKEGKFSFEIFMIYELINVISTMLFAEIILSLSFGLTVVCGSLSMPLTLILIIIGMSFFLAAVIPIIIKTVIFDDAYQFYLYNDSPGFVICIIHFIIAILVSVGSIKMLVKYPIRRNFYGIFLPLSLLWILVTPILILVSTSSSIAYLQFSLIVIGRNLADSLAHSIYMLITYPKLFPKIIMYTTPAHVIAPITFNEAMDSPAEELPTLEDHNRNFMNLSEFQSEE